MGFSHRSTAPPTTGQVAHALPHATDSLVQDAAYLGLAYERLRGAFLALSGVSLLRTLALAEQADLAGVIAIARLALDEAREHVVHVRDSASPATRIRGRRAAVAIEALAAEAARAAKDGFSEIDVRVLRAVRGALAATSLPEAGIFHLSSVSCAGYDDSAVGHDHGDSAGHRHDHGHDHRHSDRTSISKAHTHNLTRSHQDKRGPHE